MATDEERAELKETFDMFDIDGDGRITVVELEKMMKQMGQNPSQDELDKIMKNADTDGSGTLEFDEFVAVIVGNPVSDEETYIQAFKLFDKDNNGHITRDELREVLKSLGDSTSELDIDDMIEAADIDQSGTIELDEFVKLMKKKDE